MSKSGKRSAPVQRDGVGVKTIRERATALDRAIRDCDEFRMARRKMCRGELDHLAGADQEQPLLGNRGKDPLGELHRRGSHRDRRTADVGLCAHVLGDGKRTLEEAIQHEPQRARRLGMPHGLFHLAKDLRLAQHHGIEARGHAERMRHRFFARQREHIRRKRLFRHVMKILEPGDDRSRLGAVHVESVRCRSTGSPLP